MTDRKTAAPWIAGAVLLVLIGGYVGAYCWMIAPLGFGYGSVSPYYDFRMTTEPYIYLHALDSLVGRLFSPIHWLDRRVRPYVWESTP
ncbi:MAG: hypothetical protein IT428_15785 [Planctomycetaceae bacterium]|nr:hypothetical protein [Planctomycetaceae bacterium]